MTIQGPGFVGRAKGGAARAASMTPERRKEISLKASTAKKELSALPRATHGSVDHPLTIGDIEIPCYVLEDGTRVLSQRGLQTSLGMSISGGVAGEQRIVTLLEKILSKSNGPNLRYPCGEPLDFHCLSSPSLGSGHFCWLGGGCSFSSISWICPKKMASK